MEYAYRTGRQLICLFEKREILRLESISSRSECIQGLTVFKEDRFLAFVYDQLGSVVKILNGMLPNKGIVIALIFDNADQSFFLNLLRHQSSLLIVDSQ